MNDLRRALSQLVKTPAFTLLAVFSLAIGIGINSTIFTVMDSAFLRPLPVANPEEIVKFERPALTSSEYEELRGEMKTLSSLLASGYGTLLLHGPERLEPVQATAASPNYFSTLGLTPQAGRFFGGPSADAAGPVVVLSDAFWRRRFGGEVGVIGQTITLNGQPCVIVGVAPRGFAGEHRLPAVDLWYPIAARAQEFATRRGLLLTGRLRPGITPAQARAEAETVFARPRWQEVKPNRWGERVRVVSERESRMDHGGRLTFFMGPVVGLVLLVACANVSCLLLGRYEERRKEIAVRLALGASRWRVMRYLLAEGLWLSLAGATLGLLFTVWGLGAVPALLPPTLSTWTPPLQLDQRVLWLTLGLAAAATLAFGLVPAWRASRLDVAAMLKADTVHLGKTPSRNVLVIVQVAVAVTFLAVAALFVRGFLAGVNHDRGFSERNLLFALLAPERGVGRDFETKLDEMRQTLLGLPGVRTVTFGTFIVGGRPTPVRVPGDESASAESLLPCNVVDPGYFATLGIPLLHGRDFTPSDNRAGGRVAIVSAALAQRLWPGQNAMGKTIFAGRTELAPREVVGVARDVGDLAGHPATDPVFYLPLRQESFGDLALMVSTRTPPAAFAAPVRAALNRLDNSVRAVMFDTLKGRLQATMLPQWFGAWLGAVLGGLAFVLAVTGLYGVVAYAVSRRTRELGIRIAIGAAPREAVWLVLRQGLLLALCGVGLGLPAAMAAGALLQSQLFGISATDPAALAGSAGLVIVVALAASYLPARRAARVDPVVALRTE